MGRVKCWSTPNELMNSGRHSDPRPTVRRRQPRTASTGPIRLLVVARLEQAKGISELREALAGKDVAAIKQKSDALQKVMQEIGTAAYQQVSQQQQQASAGPSESPPPQGEKKDAVDVDYKVVDDKK
jgi:hypothetical protein